MIFPLIMAVGLLLFIGFCLFAYWLCTASTKVSKRMVETAEIHARAMTQYAEALNEQAEAWHQATEAEKSATTAREREAKAAEKIAAELRAMDGDEQAEFFRRVFDRKKNPRGRHTAAPPGNQNFDRN